MADDPKNEPTPKPDDASGGKPDDKSEKPDGGKGDEPKFTQAQLDAILADRLAREKASSQKQQEEAERRTKEAALEQNKEFEKLANERKTAAEQLDAKVKELEPKLETLTKRAEAAEAAVSDFVKAEMESLKLSEAIKDALRPMAPVEQLKWITKHKGELTKSGGGLPSSPDGKSGGSNIPDEQRRAQTARTW